jgi:hypothetical protein
MSKGKKNVKSENKEIYTEIPSYIVHDTALCLFDHFFVAGNPILNIKQKPKTKTKGE